MKQAIKYNADSTLLSYIQQWQDWLLKERLYSEHTTSAYARDLAIFLQTIEPEKTLSLPDLESLDVCDFRYFLSKRAAKCINKSSMGRELSAIKNFFKLIILSKTTPSAPSILPNRPKFCLKH